jgi:hypothetical protein
MNAVSGWALGRSKAPDPGILRPGRIGRGVSLTLADAADALRWWRDLEGGAGGLGPGGEAPGCRHGGLSTEIDLVAVRRAVR